MPETIPSNLRGSNLRRAAEILERLHNNRSLWDKIDQDFINDASKALNIPAGAIDQLLTGIINPPSEGQGRSEIAISALLDEMDSKLNFSSTGGHKILSEENVTESIEEKYDKLAGYLDEAFSPSVAYDSLDQEMKVALSETGLVTDPSQLKNPKRINKRLGRLVSVIGTDYHSMSDENKGKYSAMVERLASLVEYSF